MRVGVLHRTTHPLTLYTFRWGELSCTTSVLPGGALCIPWSPSAHASGDRVPVTLGAGATAHGWGPDAPDGRFLLDEAFEAFCVPVDDPPSPRGRAVRTRLTPMPTAFAELPTLLRLLRARASRVTTGVLGEVCVALAAMARVHDWAMRMELGASSFDNMGAMRHYRGIADDVLAQAQALWATTRAITRDG
ncbi:MAG: hypothetical protein JNM25_16675 [Planctomycetes bacterium]|nr:hypothetical protein [Planctomycetota bacterium]